MEISGSVLRRASVGSVDRRLLLGRSNGGVRRSAGLRVRVPARSTCGGDVFCDKGHLQYYDDRRAKEDKKRAKLIKGLKKDLSELYFMGFGDQVDQTKKISEAAEQLLEQLNQIKVEEKESKKKKKEDKKAACKKGCEEDSSSSSSSESSESYCEELQILQLSDLKTCTSTSTVNVALPNPVTPAPQSTIATITMPNPVTFVPVPAPAPAPVLTVVEEGLSGKIEVCMGGKCKKSGSIDLLQELEKKVGSEGAVVVGCKCMGKCKEGPNVRLSSYGTGTTGTGQGGLGVLRDRLCIGVGLDDVGAIVTHFFGEGEKDGAGSLIPA